MLCMAIFTNDPCTVHREDDVEILHADVVNDLVIGSLQKGRINSNDGAHARYGKPTGKCHAVLFCDTHIEIAFGEMLVHLLQAGAFCHSSRDAYDGSILLSQFYEGIGKDISVGRWITGIFLDRASRVVKCAGAMPFRRVLLSIA